MRPYKNYDTARVSLRSLSSAAEAGYRRESAAAQELDRTWDGRERTRKDTLRKEISDDEAHDRNT